MTVAETERLSDLFLVLADDPALLRRYTLDPHSVLAETDLGADAVAAVLTGTSRDVAAAVERELVGDPVRRRVAPRMTIYPDPDPEPDEDEPDEPDDPDDPEDLHR